MDLQTAFIQLAALWLALGLLFAGYVATAWSLTLLRQRRYETLILQPVYAPAAPSGTAKATLPTAARVVLGRDGPEQDVTLRVGSADPVPEHRDALQRLMEQLKKAS